jgi:hypothetical protein
MPQPPTDQFIAMCTYGGCQKVPIRPFMMAMQNNIVAHFACKKFMHFRSADQIGVIGVPFRVGGDGLEKGKIGNKLFKLGTSNAAIPVLEWNGKLINIKFKIIIDN